MKKTSGSLKTGGLKKSAGPRRMNGSAKTHIMKRSIRLLRTARLLANARLLPRSPDGPSLDALLRLQARQAGLIDGDDLEGAMRVAKILLARFRRHPLWAEIQAAGERHHGLPCHTGLQGSSGAEYIDLLYRTGPSWTLVDFHTAPLKTPSAQQTAFELRQAGLKAKQKVVEDRIGVKPRVLVCFLDVAHRVEVQEG